MARISHCADEQIIALLAELQVATGQPVSGIRLRQELKRRYGIRAGTDRIYRLLSLPRFSSESEATLEFIARLTAERNAAVARAELAELREMATQDRTANEIHDLRQEVKALRVFKT